MDTNEQVLNSMDEVIVSIPDFLLSAFRHWKLLLAGMLIGAVLLGFAGPFLRSGAAETENVSESETEALKKQVENARGALSESVAAEIEGLYLQYQEYATLQNMLRDQFVDFMRDEETANASWSKITKYLCTGEDIGPNAVFGSTVLGIAEYNEIAMIVNGGEIPEDPTRLVRNRVSVNTDNGNKMAVSDSEILPIHYVVTVRSIGNDKEQCDQIQEVVQKKLYKLTQQFVAAGGVLTIEPFTYEYSNDVATLMTNTIADINSQMKSITDAIYNLEQNAVGKKGDEAIAYYNLLKEQGALASELAEEEIIDEEAAQPVQTESESGKISFSRTFALLGAFLGLFIGLFWLFLRYIGSPVLKTKGELSVSYGIPVLNAGLVMKHAGSALYVRMHRWVDDTELASEEQTGIIARDLGISLEKADRHSLYFLLTEPSEELKKKAEDAINRIREFQPGVQLSCGNPLTNQEAMQALSESDMAVIFAQMKKTSRPSLERQLLMCARYQVPVAGAVTLEVL